MSVTADPNAAPAPAGRRSARGPARVLAVAVAAILIVAAAGAILVFLLAPAAAPRSPFGIGLREAAPAATGLGGAILSLQSVFYRSLQAALSELKESGAAFWTLLGLGFAYGVLHAAGPGHGKAVVSGYLVANGRSLAKGFALSLSAALLQALVAILLVGGAAVLLQANAAGVAKLATRVGLASFAAVAALGAVMTWRKAGRLAAIATLAADAGAVTPAAGCSHDHLPGPAEIDRLSHWREWAGVVVAAGIRPCAGAIVILVFALSQGLFAAGVAATLAMALGTALATGLIAAVAVFAKRLALGLAGGRGLAGDVAVAALELLAAAFVLVLGASLLAGLWTMAGS